MCRVHPKNKPRSELNLKNDGAISYEARVYVFPRIGLQNFQVEAKVGERLQLASPKC